MDSGKFPNMDSILDIESISLEDISVREEHFPNLLRYISLLLAILRSRFLVRRFTRILIMKLTYLIDREVLRNFNIPMTRILYINYFKGPYNPSVIEALETLVGRSVLTHGSAEYEYRILLEDRLAELARDCKNMLLEACSRLGVDYRELRKIILRVMKKTVELDNEGRLVAYVHSLPEVKTTPFGKIIKLETLTR